MRRWPRITASVLVAFLTTTAVPGSGVVAHRHGGGDHDHVHAFLAADHAGHDHRAHRHRPHRRHDHARLPGFVGDHHDPLAHVHFTSPFQPATPSAPLDAAGAVLLTSDVPRTFETPATPALDRARSRGPPPAPLA